MEYANGGDLSGKIKQQKDKLFSEEQILDWFTQICLAMKHVHDRKFIHRDLKSQNIFLNDRNQIKLGDFGIARELKATIEKARTMVGTPYYLSPEVIENKPYNQKSDMWSLGIILYELCALKPPFNAQSLQMLALKIVRGQYNPIPAQYSGELKSLITRLLEQNPERRLNIQQILKQPLIAKRIQNYLSQSIQVKEFSHTILHKQKFSMPSQQVKVVNQEKPMPEHLIQKDDNINKIEQEKKQLQQIEKQKMIQQQERERLQNIKQKEEERVRQVKIQLMEQQRKQNQIKEQEIQKIREIEKRQKQFEKDQFLMNQQMAQKNKQQVNQMENYHNQQINQVVEQKIQQYKQDLKRPSGRQSSRSKEKPNNNNNQIKQNQIYPQNIPKPNNNYQSNNSQKSNGQKLDYKKLREQEEMQKRMKIEQQNFEHDQKMKKNKQKKYKQGSQQEIKQKPQSKQGSGSLKDAMKAGRQNLKKWDKDDIQWYQKTDEPDINEEKKVDWELTEDKQLKFLIKDQEQSIKLNMQLEEFQEENKQTVTAKFEQQILDDIQDVNSNFEQLVLGQQKQEIEVGQELNDDQLEQLVQDLNANIIEDEITECKSIQNIDIDSDSEIDSNQTEKQKQKIYLEYLQPDFSVLEQLRQQLEDDFGTENFIEAYNLIKEEITQDSNLDNIENLQKHDFQVFEKFLSKDKIQEKRILIINLIVMEDKLDNM